MNRAWEILALLESDHHVAGATPIPPPDSRQLAFFETPDPILQELKGLNLNEMTPLEALSRLAEFKRRAETP